MGERAETVRSRRVREVAGLFLRLGVLGFGGPAAHIAMMRDEVVRRRGWLDDEEFMNLVGATNLIPGPNSTELAIHLGRRRAGWRGLVVAGVCFILPAFLIVVVLAWLYERNGTSPAVVDVRYGVLPVIIAIVAHAVYGLGRSVLKVPLHLLLAVAAFAAYLGDVRELVVLAVAGAIGALWVGRRHVRVTPLLPVFTMAAGPLAGRSADGRAAAPLWRLFLVFLEIGSVLYGSGYVLLAFLQRSVVNDLGWLSDQQLLDAITVGQVTPGPVFTTATFVGWQIDGPLGAVVATVGIFGPSFVFVALLGRIVPWMQERPVAKAFLDGVSMASLGLMAGVLVRLTTIAITDVATVVVGVASLLVLIRTKVNSAWLVAFGVVIGIVRAAVV